MYKVEDFLTKEEEQEIVSAIGIAEKNTSGEIRVHIEKETSIAPLDRAMEVFRRLQMENTQERNGVIIYIAIKSKQFAIYGDKGINEKVPADFWDTTKDKFLEFSDDSAWDTDVDFFESFNLQGGYYIDHVKKSGTERFSALMPEWTKLSPDRDIL
jgi:uncharacterized membrane protein